MDEVKHEQQLVFPPFRLDLQNGQVWRGSDLLPVRPKTFAILRYLVEHAGQVVTRIELLHAVWPGIYGAEGLPKEYVHELRQLLKDDAAAPKFIETVRSRQGYRWIAQGTGGGIGVQHTAPFSLAPLVGRETELAQLRQWLARALSGERQVVFVMGEPGIGKTALVETFLAQIEASQQVPSSRFQAPRFPPATRNSPAPAVARQSTIIGQGQCIEHYGAGEAYLPILEALGRLCRQPEGTHTIRLLERYAPTWLLQMPAFLEEAELETLQRKVAGATRERMLRELAEAVEVLAVERPLVLVLEDLHWSDYSTLDWLAMVARRHEAARLLIIGTYRPAEVIVSRHPLKAMKEELQRHRQCEEMVLKALTPAAVSQYLALRFAAPSPTFAGEERDEGLFHQLARIVHRSTEGNPLFMINVVDELVAQGTIREVDHQWQLPSRGEYLAVHVPENLRQLIVRQIERLSSEEQQMLEVASVIGAEFSAAVVAAAIESTIEQVEERCEEVVRREYFLHALGSETSPDGTVAAHYGFLHALYQTVLYERLPRARCIRVHRRVGESEERLYGSRAGGRAAELAVHFERGQDYPRAVQYHQQAGENALQRSANTEAIPHFTKGLELLKTLPDTLERTQHELRLEVALSLAFVMAKGYAAPEVEASCVRARELCQQMEGTPEVCATLFRLYQFFLVRGELRSALELGEQLLQVAQRMQDPIPLAVAHSALTFVLNSLGEFIAAQKHAEQGLALYDAQQHRKSIGVLYGDDPGVVCLLVRAWTLQVRGYPDQAQVGIQETLATAQQLAHRFTLNATLAGATDLYLVRRAVQAVHESATAVVAVSTQEGFPYYAARGALLRGWALAQRGQAEEGITQIQQSLAAFQTMGVGLWRPRCLGLLAEACGKAGQANEGLASLSEALAVAQRTGEREYEAELYRLKGQLTLQQFQVPGSKSTVKTRSRQVKVR